MQQVRVHDLIGRVVVTQSGIKVGILKDVILDTDSNRVLQFCVKRGLVSPQELLVSADVIIEILPEMIIVKDGNVPEGSVMVA